MSWITFEDAGTSKSGRTRQWSIMPKEGFAYIGMIRWYAAWRKYAFFPFQETVFEQDCLREIAQFIEDRTREHKTAAKLAKQPLTGFEIEVLCDMDD